MWALYLKLNMPEDDHVSSVMNIKKISDFFVKAEIRVITVQLIGGISGKGEFQSG